MDSSRPKASGANVGPADLALLLDAHLLKIGVEAALGDPVGVADVMPELRALAAYSAYPGHGLLLQRWVAGDSKGAIIAR